MINTHTNNRLSFIPTIYYSNTAIQKKDILINNKTKTGIYRWNNLVTGKSYVGSAISLSNRFTIYYSLGALKSKINKGSSAIYSALLKYGYSNFSLDILEYCESNVLISREQHFIDLFKPEYNILKIAGSKLGFKHPETTKAQMRINNKGVNNPFFGKRHTLDSRIKIGESLKSSVTINIMPKMITPETRLKLSTRTRGVSIKVFDLKDNLVKEFPTITSAAKHFNVSNRTVGRYMDKDLSYCGFIFKSCVRNFEIINIIRVKVKLVRRFFWVEELLCSNHNNPKKVNSFYKT